MAPCIACKKIVEENSLACPYYGTVAPIRVMLVPCRICGEEVGKTARKCPHCKNPNPYRDRYFCGYLVWVLFFALVFYLPIVGKLNSITILDNISLGHIFSIATWGVIVGLLYKYLKDSAGLTHFFLNIWKNLRSSSCTPCMKCYTPIPINSESCPNCGEPILKNIKNTQNWPYGNLGMVYRQQWWLL